MAQEKRRSSLWYLLPILIGIIGGAWAWYTIKQDDPIKAKNCLKLGIIMLILNITLFIALSAIYGMENVLVSNQ
jgi:hypothetical protein